MSAPRKYPKELRERAMRLMPGSNRCRRIHSPLKPGRFIQLESFQHWFGWALPCLHAQGQQKSVEKDGHFLRVTGGVSFSV